MHIFYMTILYWYLHFVFADIDECQNGAHNCGTALYCVNNEGNYSCTCPTGYQWNGETCQGTVQTTLLPGPQHPL